jgi:hypothetical protein
VVHGIKLNLTKGENMGQIVTDVIDILDYKDAKKSAKNQRQEILKKMADDETEKTNLVKKVLSTQRAKYGASGMSSNGITEGAVLKRLRSETAAPFEEKKQDNLKKLKNTKAKKVNLLEKLLSRFEDIVG